MKYSFLVETYESERLKTLNLWSSFKDDDVRLRPAPLDKRNRNPVEHMIHQCVGEDKWFCGMLGIDIAAAPLPEEETRIKFIQQYAKDSGKRVNALRKQKEGWWEEDVSFFDMKRSRAWVIVRRVAHTAHHRGELMLLLRLFGGQAHSLYGPTFDTGGLPANGASTVYAYEDIESIAKGELCGGKKSKLPGYGDKASTERP